VIAEHDVEDGRAKWQAFGIALHQHGAPRLRPSVRELLIGQVNTNYSRM